MTFGLLASLALLGLAAIDPVGLAAMPILLSQKQPLCRSLAFLGGSFVALMAMGIIFAEGAGRTVLNFENAHTWLVPTVEIIAGTILLAVGGVVFRQMRSKRESIKGPSQLERKGFKAWQLFVFGAELVTIQSLVDVVFIVAMIKVGTLHLNILQMSGAVVAYTVPALVFQAAIVGAFIATPKAHRTHLLARVRTMLSTSANKTVMLTSFTLGTLLVLNGILAFLHQPHL
ncbi:MAG TPA: GAP family protein [Candidatus Saccharimonadales bacterium]|nr:GAP family protein [Candidatus Saccharimonadales bacterium]